MNLQTSCQVKEARDTRSHISYDLIYMNSPGWVNPQREKADWWSPGAETGGNGEQLLKGTGLPLER